MQPAPVISAPQQLALAKTLDEAQQALFRAQLPAVEQQFIRLLQLVAQQGDQQLLQTRIGGTERLESRVGYFADFRRFERDGIVTVVRVPDRLQTEQVATEAEPGHLVGTVFEYLLDLHQARLHDKQRPETILHPVDRFPCLERSPVQGDPVDGSRYFTIQPGNGAQLHGSALLALRSVLYKAQGCLVRTIAQLSHILVSLYSDTVRPVSGIWRGRKNTSN